MSDQPQSETTADAGIGTARPDNVKVRIAGPIEETARLESMDVLRGFALLGIFVPNVVVFGWPMAAMTSPAVMGGGAANEWGYRITSVFFFTKMMMLFAMLFGAGTIFFGRRYEHARSVTDGYGRWAARTGLLLAIGVIHAIGLWYGDILVWYAVAGLIALWWVRRLSARILLMIGGASYAIGSVLMIGLMLVGIMAVRSSGDAATMTGDPAVEIAAYTGGYSDIVKHRVFMVLFMWFIGILWAPGIVGLMMLGMAMVKLGVFTGERSTRFYAWLGAIGIGLGLPITVGAFAACMAWDPELGGAVWQGIAQPLGIPLGLGYAGVLVLIVKKQWLPPLRAALRSVGRMALTCYLMQTVLATTFFYGYGLGNYAQIQYPGLFFVVAVVWAINIAFAVVWMRFFRFGPVEWAWRSLTYLKLQPLRR